MDKFLKIAITSPDPVTNEADKIIRLFEEGFDIVHIRKPDASIRDIRNLVEDIPYKWRGQLILHGHFELLNDFNLGGVHLNSRCPIAPPTAKSISRSCHSFTEINELEKSGELSSLRYVTLSPIYDSISKPGYNSNFSLDEIKRNIEGKNVIALGGVTPDKLQELSDAGFAGAAMLGAIWNR